MLANCARMMVSRRSLRERLTTDLRQVCDLRGSREGGGGGGGGLGEDGDHCKYGDWDYGEEREGEGGGAYILKLRSRVEGTRSEPVHSLIGHERVQLPLPKHNSSSPAELKLKATVGRKIHHHAGWISGV